MDPGLERRQEDLAKVRQLGGRSGGRITVLCSRGTPLNEIVVGLACRTAKSRAYPAQSIDRCQIRITLPARYPFEGPAVDVDPVVFHPNVFPSGRFCLGVRWIPTEGLDLLLRRVVKIVTFDPQVLNLSSPANQEAAEWYRSAVLKHRTSFPTDSVEFEDLASGRRTMSWKNVPATGKVVMSCPSCSKRLRARRMAKVRCPVCHHVFRSPA